MQGTLHLQSQLHAAFNSMCTGRAGCRVLQGLAHLSIGPPVLALAVTSIVVEAAFVPAPVRPLLRAETLPLPVEQPSAVLDTEDHFRSIRHITSVEGGSLLLATVSLSSLLLCIIA